MLGKTENRQVWIDFPYPIEIFLALIWIDFDWKFKKNNNTCFASAPGQWRPDTHCLLFSSRARPDRADDRYCDYRSNCV